MVVQAKNSKVLMKLKTPGSEGREEQDRVQSPLLPAAPPGPTFLPFARCLGEGPGHCAAPIHPPEPPTLCWEARGPGHLPQSLGPCRAPRPARHCEGWRSPWGTGCHCQGDGVAGQALSSALLPPTPSSPEQRPRPLSNMGPNGSHHLPLSPGAWLPEPL